ncbi:hypothetical protein SAMN02910301_0698 [Lachnospiraceae bacterium XBD2001]|nr:hypothetical protein SAMN02910301_0698 [Lachnospiraceae bacterium XBD2001]
MEINVKEILEKRLATSLGLDRYQYIMEHVMTTDIASDAEFQRLFNGFYIVRRNEKWRKVYYSYFESIKHKNPTFDEILTYLYENTGNLEPSFSSKMLASINPTKPIWDRYVVQNLNIKLTGATNEQRLQNAITLYSEMENWYSSFLESADGITCVKEFNHYLPDYAWISDIKKVDAILWSIR